MVKKSDKVIPVEPRIPVPSGISCAICLNQSGERIQADTIVKGYASCAQHVELVSKPNFDIFQLKTSKSFT